ncbi:MAG: adenylate/guanylate cyclase domain-containing protein [Pseudomonadota bacterium]
MQAAPELFRVAQVRAERFIALLRLGMSSILAVLLVLLLSGAAVEPTETMQRQAVFAMVTMASYFLMGLAFLLIIRAGAFRSWMSWPSALMDCGFILSGLFVSLGNLGLDGHYIWAFPTVWLIPVVLASGALRFNPVLQAAMVAVLVVGLLWLLPIAQSRDLAGLSTLEILFGTPPNLMRVAMLVIAGGVLVFASVLIRRLLIGFIEEAEARNRLTRFLPEPLAARLAGEDLDALRSGVTQRMAVVFVDIRGFTALAEAADPAAVSRLLAEFRGHVSAAAEAQGGFVDKFIGDGALVVFDDADGRAGDRAMAAVGTLLRAVAAWRSDVRVGVGAHIGDVFAGVVGDAGRLEFTVLGDVVNVAARLEAATKKVGVRALISDDMWQSLGSVPDGWHPLAELELPGRAGRVGAWAFDGADRSP